MSLVASGPPSNTTESSDPQPAQNAAPANAKQTPNTIPRDFILKGRRNTWPSSGRTVSDSAVLCRSLLNDDNFDHLEPILPPIGIEARKIADVAGVIARATAGRVDVAGVRGCATTLVAEAVARSRRVVLVTPEADDARRLASNTRSRWATTSSCSPATSRRRTPT